MGWTGRIVESCSWQANPYFEDPTIKECFGYTVYGHLTPSNKWYFGITKKPPKQRWGRHGQGYKSSPRFWNAIKKYGWDNIYHHIVGTGFTKDQACDLERYLIKEYNTLGVGGYNCTSGGDGIHDYKYTDEQKIRLRDSHLGQHSANSKPVWCVETGQFFESAAAAGRYMGASGHSIARAAHGARKTAHGYHWAYFDGSVPDLSGGPNRVKVRCNETGEVFSSLSEAAKQYGVTPQAIRYAAKDTWRTSAGFHWSVV